MNLPFFYADHLDQNLITLDEETSKHIAVLRMQTGEQLALTDGRGKMAMAEIRDNNRKKVKAEIISTEVHQKSQNKVAIGISLLKNSSRFEWFLEKATELGVDEIVPLICERTEKEKMRMDRMQQIVISAMLQSQQVWMPVLHEPMKFADAIHLQSSQKMIAHCLSGTKKSLVQIQDLNQSRLLLIGPEGDFTENEIKDALENECIPVTLGNNRLRTETAGVAGAVMMVAMANKI